MNFEEKKMNSYRFNLYTPLLIDLITKAHQKATKITGVRINVVHLRHLDIYDRLLES